MLSSGSKIAEKHKPPGILMTISFNLRFRAQDCRLLCLARAGVLSGLSALLIGCSSSHPQAATAPSTPGSAGACSLDGIDPPGAETKAIALSGGGFRAMLFHVGFMWRLNELGILQQADMISSVSGGSILAGILASRWSELDFDPTAVQPVSRR